MNKEPVIGLYPINDCVLVELKQSRKNVSVKEGKYDTRTEGIVVAVEPSDESFEEQYYADLLGKRIHFEEFKEGARIKRNGKIYSFIRLEDIRGFEDEQAS